MYFRNFAIVHLILLVLFSLSDCLNILAVMPHVGKSHQLVYEPLFRKLVSNGHKMTLITRYPQKDPVPNWRDVNIANEEFASTEILSFNDFTGTRLDRYGLVGILASIGYQSCKEGLSHPNYQKFLKEDNHFDIILIEVFNTPCFMGVVKRYNAPVIGLSSCIWMPWTYQWFGTSSNPSYVSNHFLGYTDKISFLGRVDNALTHVFTNVVYNIFMDYLGKRLSIEHTGIDLDENGDIMSNISVILINTHFTLNPKMPISPNTIEVGGIHVESQPLKPLPQDLEKFVSESEHGVIYMSMGSTMKGDTFPEDKKQAFLKAFARLPQRIIWKWEGEMKNKPQNVMTYKWAPQRDILCHPNVKVFISHAGLLGTIETVNCGTPLLMIPLFGDQFTNAAFVEQNGGGLTLNMNDVSEEVVYEKLQKLLSRQFATSAKELSNRYNDRPMSSMNTALYWIDYVARHKGARFMKVASVDMPLYQYYLLDVIAFVAVLVVIYFYVFYLIVKFIFRKLCKRQEKIKTS